MLHSYRPSAVRRNACEPMRPQRLQVLARERRNPERLAIFCPEQHGLCHASPSVDSLQEHPWQAGPQHAPPTGSLWLRIGLRPRDGLR